MHVREIPAVLESQVDELLNAVPHGRERGLGILDERAVRRQEEIRVALREDSAGDVRRRQPLDAAVRPLGRGERPELAVAVEQVAAEGEPLAGDLDEIADGARRVAGGRQGEERMTADLLGAVLGDDSGNGHGVEEREPVLPEVVVVVQPSVLPVPVDLCDQRVLERRNPDPGARGDRASEPLDAGRDGGG